MKSPSSGKAAEKLMHLSEINTEITSRTITNMKMPKVLYKICNGYIMKRASTLKWSFKSLWILSCRDQEKKKGVTKLFHKEWNEMQCGVDACDQAPDSISSPLDCYLHTERVYNSRKTRNERRRQALTVLAVPSHVLPWAFTWVVGNQIRANAPILARVPFTLINICRGERKKRNKRCINSFGGAM